MMHPLQSLWFLLRNPNPPKGVDEKRPWFKPKTRGNWAWFVVLLLIFLCIFNAPFYLAKQAFNSLNTLDESRFNFDNTGEIRKTIQELVNPAQTKDPAGYERVLIQKMRKSSNESKMRKEDKAKFNELLNKIEALPSAVPRISITAPPNISKVMGVGLVRHGFVVVHEPCASCIPLTWRQEGGWRYDLPEGTNEEYSDAIQWKITRSALYAFELANKNQITSLEVDKSTLIKDAQAVLLRMFVIFINLAMVFVAWILLWSGGLVGGLWEMERSEGALEPIATAIHPPWVLFCADIARSSRTSFIIFAVICATGVLWGLPLQWNILVTLLLFVPAGVFMVGLWGMLSTVIFHHKSGRRYARLLFSPLTLLMALGGRVFILAIALQSTNPVRANAMGMWFLENGQWPILAAIPVVILISALLLGIINWRIGVRREGLRMCK